MGDPMSRKARVEALRQQRLAEEAQARIDKRAAKDQARAEHKQARSDRWEEYLAAPLWDRTLVGTFVIGCGVAVLAFLAFVIWLCTKPWGLGIVLFFLLAWGLIWLRALGGGPIGKPRSRPSGGGWQWP